MNKKILVLRVAIIIVFTVLAILLSQNVDTAGQIRDAVVSFGPLGWIGFIALYATATVLFIPGTILTIAGALLFGLWFGFLLNILGATLGATAAYVLARVMGREVFESLAPKKLLELERRVTKRPFESVLVLRLVPIIPYNVVNFGLGVSSVRLKPYVWGTFLGMMPACFAYTYATVKVGEVISETGLRSLSGQDFLSLLPALLILLVVAVIPVVVSRFRRNKLNKD